MQVQVQGEQTAGVTGAPCVSAGAEGSTQFISNGGKCLCFIVSFSCPLFLDVLCVCV